MSEKVQEKTVFTLLEVTQSIQRTLNERYQTSFWVKAEMNKLNHYKQSGHCYPDLLEKRDGKIVAQIRSTLWKDDFIRINENFVRVLKEPLKDGINILFVAKIGFDPLYGLSLRIIDVDPSWSLGELEREKLASIEKLLKEGVFAQNKTLSLPLLPQRIAVISVETSKGYADFLKVIDRNPWGYHFFHMLFPSLLQGDTVTESIICQLNRIKKVINHFDIVTIIRGGGGDIGLSGFNRYELAKNIACFPLPVLTGIGHVTNETVAEMVAFKNCITPTELADFLVQQFHNFSVPVKESQQTLISAVTLQIEEAKKETDRSVAVFLKHTRALLLHSGRELFSRADRVKSHTGFYLRNALGNVVRLSGLLEKNAKTRLLVSSLATSVLQSGLFRLAGLLFDNLDKELTALDRLLSLLDPRKVLARGFSITLNGGKPLHTHHEVHPGDHLETIIYDGTVHSTVTGMEGPRVMESDHKD
ncbi:MAG: exodeoxyribonuclease VII large subunit [Bacteroidota bacterium]